MKYQELIQRIEFAYRNTPPGQVGIRQALAMDNRLEGKQLFDARRADVETDWKDIPDQWITRNPVFPYFDDAGFKFFLPAVMRWFAKLDFDFSKDKNLIAEFLIYQLLPESRKADNPEILAKRWLLSKDQISILIEWLEECRKHTTMFGSSDLETAQFERWKQLVLKSSG